MLNVEIDREQGIAILQPQGPLSASDFGAAAQVIDPYIAEIGSLHGLIISTRDFPGWESFSALVSHIRFVKNHQAQLQKVAVVTDATIGDFAEKIGGHFVSAKVKRYPFDQFDSAKNWILGR